MTKTEEAKTQSEIAVVRTFQKAMDNANALITDYNEKYVKKAVETGKVLAVDMRKNTKEAFEGVVEDSKKIITRIPMVENIAPKMVESVDAEADFYVVKTFQKATDSASAAIKEYNDVVKKTFESGREWVDTFGKKTKENSQGVVENAKSNVNKAKETVEEKAATVKENVTAKLEAAKTQMSEKVAALKATQIATEKFNAVKAQVTEAVNARMDKGFAALTKAMDLPTRKDIQSLTRAMNKLSKKVDALSDK